MRNMNRHSQQVDRLLIAEGLRAFGDGFVSLAAAAVPAGTRIQPAASGRDRCCGATRPARLARLALFPGICQAYAGTSAMNGVFTERISLPFTNRRSV